HRSASKGRSCHRSVFRAVNHAAVRKSMHPDPRKLENWVDPDRDRGLLYFIQRLDELTFPYTIDSYRAPTMSPPDLAEECIEAITFARSQSKSEKSIWHILDEFESRLSKNPVVSSLLKVELHRHLNYDRNSFSDIERKLKVLSREISRRSYALKCFELAEEFCSENKKGKIEFVAREMVTSLTNYGVSFRQINQTVSNFFFKSKVVDGVSSLRPFFTEIFPHHHQFKVLFKCDTLVESLPEGVLELFSLEFADSIPVEFKGKGRAARIPKLKSNESYLIEKNIGATDKFSAVEVARDKIQRLHDLFGIYHHKLSYHFDERTFSLQKCCADDLSEVKVDENPMLFTLDNSASDAATKLDSLTDVLRLPGGPDRERFFRIVAFHGSASQTDNIETKIVNIWTALETMAPSNRNGAIVSNVIEAALPIISLNYFRRIFRTLTWDILRWNRRLLTKALKKSDFLEENDLIEKVFSLVVLPNNEDALSGLLADLRNFELLRYRIYSLHQIFASRDLAIKLLEEHERRVEWQLHRIYRTRNRIIHTGSSPSNTKALFANAHDYFDQIFDVSCDLCSGSSGYNNYEDAFNFSKALHEQYRSKLKEAVSMDTSSASIWLWTAPNEPDARRWFRE
ncbi:MAG: hypothetical protein MRY75_12065, partial [Marivita sp.]|uniref:hypothetical protein n=1 Tax=Marivita sp. TaxID=2003365 RepID=UPI0025C0ED85